MSGAIELAEVRSLALHATTILNDILRDSEALGIPSIDPMDGAVLMAEAFKVATSGGRIFLDLGAGVGYSTAWIALGVEMGCLEGNCTVKAVEIDPYRAERLERNMQRLGLNKVEVKVVRDEALRLLMALEPGSVSMAFVDIEKNQYLEALNLLKTKLRPGGVALFHNAFFPEPPPEFFNAVSQAPWRSSVIPTPAGLLVAILHKG